MARRARGACRRAGASGRPGAGGRAGGRRAGARGAQAGRRQRARQAQALARGAGPERAYRAAWACLCAQAGRAGWSAGLVLVHSAPGSVLTQFSIPFDSVFS